VRAELADVPVESPVAVAVSGGPDSLALLFATVAVAGPLRLPVAALTVDHRWHADSARVAAAVAATARAAGCAPVEVLDARAAGPPPGDGPEADARHARYALLDSAVARHGLVAVLLGHTLDDQAESVLLGLARGSGARSLAGMPARRGPYRRPLLPLRRAVVRAALADLTDPAAAAVGPLPPGLPWQDPANTDRRHPRARIRADVLPVLETALGPGAAAGLARSAGLLREDADALDALAAEVVARLSPPAPVDTDLRELSGLPDAVLARVVRLLAGRCGAGPLTAAHTRALADLVRARSGSGAGPLRLPGGVAARRARGRLLLGPGAPAPGGPADLKEQ
jgi:tRNA(Ile)-lysidine synthetase-like protein